MKTITYIVVFLAVQLATQLLAVAAFQALNHGAPGADLPPLWQMAVMAFFSVATIAVFLKAGWFKASPRYMRSRPWAVLAWSVVAALGAIVPSLVVQGVIPQWTGWARELAEQTNAQLEALMSVPGGYMVIALLPPVVEEMVFRGCVLKSLLHWQPRHRWAMIALSALLFALVHLNPAQMPHAFLVGLLLGWMYQRTGSIIPGVAYHWANNTASYALFHLYHNPQSLADIVGPGMRPTLLALLFSLCILLPALYQLHLRMRHLPRQE